MNLQHIAASDVGFDPDDQENPNLATVETPTHPSTITSTSYNSSELGPLSDILVNGLTPKNRIFAKYFDAFKGFKTCRVCSQVYSPHLSNKICLSHLNEKHYDKIKKDVFIIDGSEMMYADINYKFNDSFLKFPECRKCNTFYTSSDKLEEHRSTHSDQLICFGGLPDQQSTWGCGQKFAKSSTLSRHLSISPVCSENILAVIGRFHENKKYDLIDEFGTYELIRTYMSLNNIKNGLFNCCSWYQGTKYGCNKTFEIYESFYNHVRACSKLSKMKEIIGSIESDCILRDSIQKALFQKSYENTNKYHDTICGLEFPSESLLIEHWKADTDCVGLYFKKYIKHAEEFGLNVASRVLPEHLSPYMLCSIMQNYICKCMKSFKVHRDFIQHITISGCFDEERVLFTNKLFEEGIESASRLIPKLPMKMEEISIFLCNIRSERQEFGCNRTFRTLTDFMNHLKGGCINTWRDEVWESNIHVPMFLKSLIKYEQSSILENSNFDWDLIKTRAQHLYNYCCKFSIGSESFGCSVIIHDRVYYLNHIKVCPQLERYKTLVQINNIYIDGDEDAKKALRRSPKKIACCCDFTFKLPQNKTFKVGCGGTYSDIRALRRHLETSVCLYSFRKNFTESEIQQVDVDKYLMKILLAPTQFTCKGSIGGYDFGCASKFESIEKYIYHLGHCTNTIFQIYLTIFCLGSEVLKNTELYKILEKAFDDPYTFLLNYSLIANGNKYLCHGIFDGVSFGCMKYFEGVKVLAIHWETSRCINNLKIKIANNNEQLETISRYLKNRLQTTIRQPPLYSCHFLFAGYRFGCNKRYSTKEELHDHLKREGSCHAKVVRSSLIHKLIGGSKKPQDVVEFEYLSKKYTDSVFENRSKKKFSLTKKQYRCWFNLIYPNGCKKFFTSKSDFFKHLRGKCLGRLLDLYLISYTNKSFPKNFDLKLLHEAYNHDENESIQSVARRVERHYTFDFKKIDDNIVSFAEGEYEEKYEISQEDSLHGIPLLGGESDVNNIKDQLRNLQLCINNLSFEETDCAILKKLSSFEEANSESEEKSSKIEEFEFVTDESDSCVGYTNSDTEDVESYVGYTNSDTEDVESYVGYTNSDTESDSYSVYRDSDIEDSDSESDTESDSDLYVDYSNDQMGDDVSLEEALNSDQMTIDREN
ncbi:hypothetical protein G210_3794 [Candida maltosa Xu316]|uniref:C2H2-type domain-containing protein n=1 Tax=Candida maltosa (strain Xu316) TaxID=1245528 RepID=M3JT19_CANMX|nr:hypothetical protein G210_3794 [Candida maltosa Xu316]